MCFHTGDLSICSFNRFNLRVSAQHPCADNCVCRLQNGHVYNQKNGNHYRCPRPGFYLFTWQTCIASHSAVTLRGLAAAWRSTSAGQVVSRCRVRRTTHLSPVADGLSVAKETVPTGTDISPILVLTLHPAGSPARPGPLAVGVGSLSPESALVATIYDNRRLERYSWDPSGWI